MARANAVDEAVAKLQRASERGAHVLLCDHGGDYRRAELEALSRSDDAKTTREAEHWMRAAVWLGAQRPEAVRAAQRGAAVSTPVLAGFCRVTARLPLEGGGTKLRTSWAKEATTPKQAARGIRSFRVLAKDGSNVERGNTTVVELLITGANEPDLVVEPAQLNLLYAELELVPPREAV